MVLPGQFLERSVVVEGPAGLLDALYHRGTRAPPCLLAAPHPALGGSMHAPVIAELAWALTQAGHSTMRFDYRGVGASEGHSRHRAGQLAADLADEVDDALAVLRHLASTAGAGSVCAVGYSFGAGVALRAAQDAAVERIVLVAPPTAMIDFSALRALKKPALVVAAHHDALCDRAVIQEMLGDQHQLTVVPHADHVFVRGLSEVGREAVRWLGTPEERPRGEIEMHDAGGPPLELQEDD